jgi:hypothetical protein
MRFLSRSQAARGAQKVCAPGETFYTFDIQDSQHGRIWKYSTHRREIPGLAEWAKGKDYVHHTESQSADGFRTAGNQGVLVVTCTLDEIPPAELADAKAKGFRFEPITPSLFKPDAPDKPDRGPSEPRAKSEVESPTKLVWEIADSMPGASRNEIVDACVKRGVNKSTAGTQFYRWQKARSV